MSIRIVADSSSDTFNLKGVPFGVVPVAILTEEQEFLDDGTLNVEEMVNYLLKYRGKSHTACLAPSQWIKSFGDAEEIICFTVTSALSGCYNSACLAKEEYERQNPGRKVFVVDTLSTGPETRLLMEKTVEYIKEGLPFEEICNKIKEYKCKTGLLFMLESMRNLANNGRVSQIAAKAAGLLGIRIVGRASDKGVLELLEKSRGEKKAISDMFKNMLNMGFKGGKVRITHCFNNEGAKALQELIIEKFPASDIEIYNTSGLCAFYAEKSGMIVGFEK